MKKEEVSSIYREIRLKSNAEKNFEVKKVNGEKILYLFEKKYTGEYNQIRRIVEWDYEKRDFHNVEVAIKGFYKNGKKEDTFTGYFQNGNIYSQEFYKAGELKEGKYFYEDLIVKAEKFEKFNRIFENEYYPSGNLRKRTTKKIYKDKILIKEIEYYETGELLGTQDRITLKNDKAPLKFKYKRYYKNGNLQLVKIYKGSLIKTIKYYPDGKMYELYEYYEKSNAVKTITEFYENEEIKRVRHFKKIEKNISIEEIESSDENIDTRKETRKQKVEKEYSFEKKLEEFLSRINTIPKTQKQSIGRCLKILIDKFID